MPPRPTDISHLDEVVVTIAGKKRWLWRAVDQDGYILDEIVQTRREHQGAQAPTDPIDEEAKHGAQAHHHRQAVLIWSRQAAGNAEGRAPVPQELEQQG
jgi:hypothetical protein